MSKENKNHSIDKKDLFSLGLEPYAVIPACELDLQMNETIVPELAKLGTAFCLKAADGHEISGISFMPTAVDCENSDSNSEVNQPANDAESASCRGTIMISHGFTESWEKFREMIHYFLQEGYAVVAHDHRGHGCSRDGHLTEKEPTHIERFQDYVDDFHTVVTDVLQKLPKPYYLYAHSMGGAIGATYAQQHPKVFAKLIFNAPMFEINRGGIPYFAAKGIASLLCALGRGKDFLPGQGTFSLKEDFENSASTCRERYLQFFRLQTEHPHLRNCGSSCRWTLESFKADEELLKEENCAKLTVPVLLFRAEKDAFVLPGGQDTLISQVPQGELVFVPGAKHEIYLSDDRTMGIYLKKVFTFLDSR